MTLIPGLPKLRRKRDPSECSVPDCTHNWHMPVHAWPVCWLHYLDHLEAEKFEDQKSHTARMLESASEAAAAAGATDGARPHLCHFLPSAGCRGCPSGAPAPVLHSFLSLRVDASGAERPRRVLHLVTRRSVSETRSAMTSRVRRGTPLFRQGPARLLSSIRGRVGAIPHWHQNPARLLPITSGPGTPDFQTRPVFALFPAAVPAEGKLPKHTQHPRTTKRGGGFLR